MEINELPQLPQKVHPLLEHVSDQTTALVWALFSLVIWGAMFPLSVYAAAM